MKFRFPIVIIDEDYRSENTSGLGIRALADAIEKEGMEVLGATSYGDLSQFAQANGAYHSWPFVRETIYGLTSRMGFPPYTLPVLSFVADKSKAPEVTAEQKQPPVESPAPQETEPKAK